MLNRVGNYQESERLSREIIGTPVGEGDVGSRLLLPPAYHDLASSLLHQQRYEEARAACAMAREITNDLLGLEPHLRLVEILCVEAAVEQAVGDLPAARALYEKALSMARSARPEPGLDLAEALSGLAGVLVQQGDPVASVPLLQESLEIQRNILPPRNSRLAKGLRELETALRAADRNEEADRVAQEDSVDSISPKAPSTPQ